MHADLDQDRITADVADQPGRAHRTPQRRMGGGLPLLTAKLTPASLPGPVVARPRLVRQLDAAAEHPVTLVSAPAGWGKTTLLSSWFRDRRHDRPLAWLTVGPDDGGARLWSYLRAALTSAGGGPERGDAALPVPDSQVDDGFLIHLADALASRPQPATLVIDDLHRVDDPDVLDGVDFLLRHADERLRLVIGSRADPPLPMHRWRLSGELAEIRVADLSFTTVEAAELLAGHGTSLPGEHLAQLHAHTEGWPVGLRLAALALRGQPDPARFVDEFGGEHPSVAAYLDEEVLAGLSAEAREALRCASIVPRFSGGLVSALTGHTDGDRLLDEAEHVTGFVVPVGTRPVTYRCHRMLGDLLRARLRGRAPVEVGDLHHRAATWCAAHDLPAQALSHALAAGRWDQAVRVLIDHWRDLAVDQPVETTDPPAPPPPDEVVRADPQLALACAADRLCGGDPRAADDYLHLAARNEHLLQGDRRSRFAPMLAAFLLRRAQRGGDEPNVLVAARRLLALVPSESAVDGAPADPGTRAIAHAALGTVALEADDLAGAEARWADGMADAERAGLCRGTLACASRLAFVRAIRGELRAAERTARAALSMPAGGGGSGAADRAHAYLALAVVALHRDRPEDAQANLALATSVGGPGAASGEPALAAFVELVRAQLAQDRGELTVGYQALSAGRRRAEPLASRHLTHGFDVVEAGLCIARGDVEATRDLVERLIEQDGEPVAPLAVVLARARLRAGDPRGAARTLPPWEASSWPLPVRLEAGLLDAVTAHQLGDQRRAARVLEQVLHLAEPDGFRRVFTREPAARALLTAHLDSGTAHWPLVNELITASHDVEEAVRAPTVAGEPLTDRELTVLRYLQSILSNVEIAAELSLSVNTVKTHLRNIYRKLDATRRRDAVRRARELHLL